MYFTSVNFQPLLQSSVLHDNSEIILILICWFGAQETFLIIVNDNDIFFTYDIMTILQKIQINAVYLNFLFIK